MKNTKFIVLALLLGISAIGQNNKGFNPWAFTAEIGILSVDDMSFVSSSINKIDTHLALGFRYSFNQTFGLSFLAAKENLVGTSLENDFKSLSQEQIDYRRFNLEGNVNLMSLFGMYSRTFTMLAHAGPGISTTETSLGYRETIGQVHAGLSGIFRLNSRIGLRIDGGATTHFGQEKTLDGQFSYLHKGSSSIYNASAGIIVWLGKNDKEPADYFRKPECTTNVYISKPSPAVSDANEYVFFEHDKAVLKGSQYPSVYKAYKALLNDDSKRVVIVGWASATSGTDRYNLDLALRRCETIKSKLMEMGITGDRIQLDPRGKDFSLQGRSVLEMGRRIEILIK